MLLIWWGPQVRQFNKADPNDRQEEGMCPVLLLRYREAQKHRTAAPCLMKLGLRREVLERRERASTLRCFEVVMLLALSVLVFLATGAMAQSPEIIPPVLSSGLRDACSAPPCLVDRSGDPGVHRPVREFLGLQRARRCFGIWSSANGRL